MPSFLRHFRNHFTLVQGAGATLIAIGLASHYMPLSQAVLLGWCSGVAIYLGLALRVATQCSTAEMRRRARSFDVSSGFISAVTLVAAVVSITAIIADLGQAGPSGHSALSIALVGATLVLSWLFLQTIFAFHYAHLFYQEKQVLSFPGTDEPHYWDFLYFSTVIGMTAQVSDVTTGNPKIRRLVMVHGIISFFFNTAILALGVNLAAGLVH